MIVDPSFILKSPHLRSPKQRSYFNTKPYWANPKHSLFLLVPVSSNVRRTLAFKDAKFTPYKHGSFPIPAMVLQAL